jgi:hypothetical protein
LTPHRANERTLGYQANLTKRWVSLHSDGR